jgi:hypothetical protein
MLSFFLSSVGRMKVLQGQMKVLCDDGDAVVQATDQENLGIGDPSHGDGLQPRYLSAHCDHS